LPKDLVNAHLKRLLGLMWYYNNTKKVN
jgi:hypothetical protein